MGIETLAIASLGASVIGGGVSAIGAGVTANATAASYNYKAQVAANNKIIADRNAQAAIESGSTQGLANDLKTKNLVGTQVVAEAAGGLDVNTGTNKAIQTSAIDLGHLDTLTIINNASKKAAGFKAQGMNFMAESQLDTMAADNAKTAGEFQVATSLLGSASSFSDKWLGYQQKGIL